MSAKQLMLLAEIDWPATEKRVKEALDKARIYIQIGCHPGYEASVTPGYSIVPPTKTNQFRSSTENIATKNVDVEIERREHVQHVFAAIRRLGVRERELIKTRWFGDDDMTDIETYIELNMSQSTYYRVRGRALYKLAFALRLEVYKPGRV